MTLDDFLSRLEGVRPAGNGHVAICPAHPDSNPSLTVTESGGSILVKCQAGCETKDVVAAMGLTLADLFVNSRSSHKRGAIEATYDYVDERGQLLFQAVRHVGKRFGQRHLDPTHEDADDEGWVWGIGDIRRVPYRLPELLEAVAAGKIIYIVEGEKDVDRAFKEGKVATCNPMGAGKWRPEFSQYFQGATVIIVVDRDESGRKHAEIVEKMLDGSARGVLKVQARAGKDLSDHLDAGHTFDELKVLKKQRRGVVTAAELAERALERLEMTQVDLPGYVLLNEVPIVFRPGRMYPVGGYSGDGKTSFALQGYRMLSSAQRKVGYFSLEMSDIDLMNRLVAHRGVPLKYTEEPWLLKADPAMMARYLEAVEEVRGWQSEIVFDSGINAEEIRAHTIDREYEVVIVDHLHRFSESGDRKTLDVQVKALTNLALDLNVLVIVLCQLRKAPRGKDLEAYPRPTLQEFRETSQIGDDASMALAIWRQRDAAGMSYVGPSEVVILKNRFTTGPQDAVGKSFAPLFYDIERQMFIPSPQQGAIYQGGYA